MAIQRIIHAVMFIPGPKSWGLPVLFWGPPGGAKTDIIEEVCKSVAMHCEILSPGERGEGAFGCTPIPSGEGENMCIRYPRADWTSNFEDSDDRGLVFVDETNTAPPAYQPALLGLIHAGRIGSHFLGRGIRRLGAANPADQAAAGWDLPAPLANRFGHIDFQMPTADEWGTWLIGNDGLKNKVPVKIKAEDEEARVLEAWPVAYAKAKGLVRGFVRARPELLHQMPTMDNPQSGRAWPSLRTWDLATRAIAGAEIHKLNPVEHDLLVAGFVGEPALVELIKYKHAMDLPNPEDVLNGKVRFIHDPDRLDRTFAVYSSCTSWLLGVDDKYPNKQSMIDEMWKLIGGVMKDAEDIAALTAKPISKRFGTAKAAVPVLAKLKPILEQIGV